MTYPNWPKKWPQPTRRNVGNMVILATGVFPWALDNDIDKQMVLCNGERGDKWIICCGQWWYPHEAENFHRAGLVDNGKPDEHGRQTLVITCAGREWLARAMSDD